MRAPLIVELRGRLGNQLFEFAAAYALSQRLGCELLFSSRRLWNAPLALPGLIGGLYREATLGQLLRVGRFDYPIPGMLHVDAAWGVAARTWSRITGHDLIVESDREVVDPRVLRARPPFVLRGYFESERCFGDRASEVDDAIRLPPLAGVLPRELPRPIVGVSFRRGDFNVHGATLPLEYYESALSSLCDRVRPGTIMVFGDDPVFNELAQPWLRRFVPVVIGQRTPDDPLVTLAEFAACDHNVIANSTFSWWGAWLGERRAPSATERLVLAPSDWRRGRPTPDLIPDRWTAVSW
jgi:hypothetical protein